MKHHCAPRDLPPALAIFENDRVEMILQAFKLTAHKFKLIDDADDTFGVRRLTLSSFYKFFPRFPILFAARMHSRVPEKCRPADLFRSVDKLFLFPSYLEVYAAHQEEAEGRPIGMVLPFDGYRGGMLMHNATDAVCVHDGEHGTRQPKVTVYVPGDVPPHRLTIESFDGYIKYLARGGWTPKTPLSDKHPVQPPQVSKEISHLPWMMEALGPSPALIVLGWFRKVLGSSSDYDRNYVRRLNENERCVLATHEQIAAETRLSARRVKRALADLRAEDFIVTPKEHPSRILLTAKALADDGDAVEE